jgi:sugar phosphate permease
MYLFPTHPTLLYSTPHIPFLTLLLHNYTAYGIFQLHGSLHNWQYLFIIEGALTCLIALIAWFWLPFGPGSAWFLTPSQRQFATTRMQIDSARYVQHTYGADGIEKSKERLTKRDVKETAKDWKLWYILPFNICASVPGQAFSVFLPLVVKGLGYESIRANLMSVPPYVCGAVGLYLFAYSSDHHRNRGPHILAGLLISVIGLIVTVTSPRHWSQYLGLCILLFGSYVSAPLTVAWLSGNTPEPGKRSLVVGVNGFGNLAGIIGAELFRKSYAPKYRLPFYVTLGLLCLAICGYGSYIFVLKAVNRRRKSQMVGWTEAELEEERRSDVRYGDRKRVFVYGI